MRKVALVLFASAMVILGVSAPAGAQARPPVCPYKQVCITATVSPASSPAGSPVTVTVNGCAANSPVIVVFNGATSTVTTDASGSATVTLTAPSAAGTYAGTATCGDVVASFSVVVTAAAAPPGGLPATGSGGLNTSTGIAMGLLAVGFGLFGVTLVRRRQVAAA